MDIHEALAASASGVAEGKSAKGKLQYAMKTGQGNIRIIRSFTDPTVLKKLSAHDWRYKGWEPATRGK